MAGRPLQHNPRTFDEAKLAAMVEPLSIRIEKRKGSARTPIALPEGADGQPPGTGWTKDDVRRVEDWLVNEWAGGGYYQITVTDSSAPNPIVMTWEPFWDPKQFPEKIPPTMATAAAQNETPSTPPPPTQVRPMTSPAFPGGLPPGMPAPAAPAGSPPVPSPFYGAASYGYGYGFPSYGGYPPSGATQQQIWQAEAERRRTEEERRRAEEERKKWEEEVKKREHELQAAREAAMRKEYEAMLERERQASAERMKTMESQIGELRQLVTQLTTVVQNGVQRNPELEMLKEQARQNAERLEREQREREAERRDLAIREMIRAQQEASQKQYETLQRQFEQQLQQITRAMESRGPDPAFSLMKEIIAQNNQALKDLSHQNSLQFERMQAMMMKPQDLMLLTKESQGSVDQITERMTRYFGNVIDMQSKVMEQALSLQPQGSGAIDMVRDGLTSVKELAERYVGMKQAQAQAAAQAQVEMTQAQVEAMRIQAEMQRQAEAAAEGAAYPPPPPSAEAQLAGVSLNSRANGKRSKAPEISMPPGTKLDSKKRLGRTDFEWFGPLLAEVLQLRDGVNRFIESLSMDPPRLDKNGQPEGISAEMTAAGIVQAMQMVAQAGVAVPAMVDLLNQQRYADFLDILLPDAPQKYRDDVVAVLIENLKSIGINKPAVPATKQTDADDDEDDGDEGEDGDEDPERDDNNDGKVTTLAVARRNGRAPRARA